MTQLVEKGSGFGGRTGQIFKEYIHNQGHRHSASLSEFIMVMQRPKRKHLSSCSVLNLFLFVFPSRNAVTLCFPKIFSKKLIRDTAFSISDNDRTGV